MKSCFFCKHGKLHAGHGGDFFTPPEPDEIECKNPNVGDFDQWDLDEEKLAEACGGYEPRIVEKCFYCKTEMNIPEHDAGYYFEDHVVCSNDCQKKASKEFHGLDIPF